ncbi:M20/M25/M40 family metallo-hydrolase [Allosphingosinicella flava]|uniref:Carboxypeptidase Q n=1 Tax=Allosphingosinicella flava TaxID=2771430 RepID=A0A7T2GKS0_9SPHN|nr:M20/M25/M40 family metallo-hydrolase [Sphingosinicella flava]QPQ55681.1 M20/M25/M40 family metallo-hydrolase [Sphingosinicella flava]
MKKPIFIAALALLSSTAVAVTPATPLKTAEMLRDAALKDDVAFDITEGLTTEVGQRMAGTEAEARARDWAVAKLKSLGFKNVRVETFDMPVWVRGEEKAEIVAPFPQKLTLAALGNSGATPPEGLRAEVIGFDSLAEFQAAHDALVKGKIVFVSHGMVPTQDGSGYGYYGAARRQGPSIASRKGAAAIVIRSIGTDHHRNPHTGVQSWAEGVTPIPAAALSIPDAEQLQRILKRAGNRPVTMHLTLTPRNIGIQQSGNVIAEVPGRDPKAPVVLAACHLDSWDLATGAFDDAAGCGITAAAAKRVMDHGQPLRTIRVVWFGAEEVGLFGGLDYMRKHPNEHAVIAESDFGADRVWRFDSRVAQTAQPVVQDIARALAPLGIAQGFTDQAGGSDIGPMAASGVPTMELQQDGTRYFDIHHTPDDTLDKIDPEQLRQNVAAWTAMLSLTSNAAVEFGPMPPVQR